MLDALARYWWVVALRGALAVLFGVLALVWPGITLAALVLLFGGYALVDGVFALGNAFFGGARAEGRRPWLILEGVVGIIVGILTFVWPGITALALLWVIAAWAIITGVLEIATAIRLRRELRGEWMLIASGVLSVIFGLILAVRPGPGAVALVWVIGIYAIIFGVSLLFLAFRLRRGAPGRPVDTDRPGWRDQPGPSHA
jgi:uncharacterized membrane protein HdeD (DUF308 family)